MTRFEEDWLCDWIVIIRLIVGEVEEIFNFERVFSWILTLGLFFLGGVCFGEIYTSMHINTPIFLFLSKSWCMMHVYFTSREHYFFFRVWRWNKDLTSAIVLILCPYNLFYHRFFIGTKSIFISWNFFSIATFWKYVYLFNFLVLIEWFLFMWLFITSGRHHKQAVVTQSKVAKTT